MFRWSILVGDLPVHDLHHVAGRACVAPDSWRYGAFARQRSVDEGDPAGLAGHEALGLIEALDRVFEGLSTAPVRQGRS